MRHSNGAVRLLDVVLSEPNPSDFQYFLQTFLNQRHMDNNSFGIEFDTGKSKVSVLSPDGMKAFYGMETERAERGMRFSAFALGVKNLGQVESRLKNSGIIHHTIGPKLIVPPAPGQGATIAFEEIA